MTQFRAVLAGTGICVPPLEVDNTMLSRIIETSDDWVRERSGISTRYYVEAGVASSDLGAAAAKAALDDAGVGLDEIDYLVCATMTPDHYFPGTGTLIQQKLGLRPLPALDIRQQCAGFAYGLQMVDALIRGGIAKHRAAGRRRRPHLADAVLGADLRGPARPRPRAAAGRGLRVELALPQPAGAVRRRRRGDGLQGGGDRRRGGTREERGILASALYGDGNHRDILFVPGGGSACRPFVTPEMIAAALTVPVMDGKQVFKLAVTRMPEVTVEVLKRRGYTTADLDLVIMHQANLRINEKAQQVLGLPSSKVFNNIQKYGNTTSATLPLAFHEARQAGLAPEGSLVAFTALGAGLHWGAVLMRV